jgi:hypothetical protein
MRANARGGVGTALPGRKETGVVAITVQLLCFRLRDTSPDFGLCTLYHCRWLFGSWGREGKHGGLSNMVLLGSYSWGFRVAMVG